jgi:hypothetical protein
MPTAVGSQRFATEAAFQTLPNQLGGDEADGLGEALHHSKRVGRPSLPPFRETDEISIISRCARSRAVLTRISRSSQVSVAMLV